MSSDGDDSRDDDATEAVPERSLADRVYWGFLIVMQLVMAVELVFLLVETHWLNALLVACIMVLIMAPAFVAPRLHVRIPALPFLHEQQ